MIALTCTPSGSADVASYQVYWGTVSGVYTNSVNVGKTNSYVNTGLSSGTTYFFVVTAVSTSGVESVFSNQAQFTSP